MKPGRYSEDPILFTIGHQSSHSNWKPEAVYHGSQNKDQHPWQSQQGPRRSQPCLAAPAPPASWVPLTQAFSQSPSQASPPALSRMLRPLSQDIGDPLSWKRQPHLSLSLHPPPHAVCLDNRKSPFRYWRHVCSSGNTLMIRSHARVICSILIH